MSMTFEPGRSVAAFIEAISGTSDVVSAAIAAVDSMAAVLAADTVAILQDRAVLAVRGVLDPGMPQPRVPATGAACETAGARSVLTVAIGRHTGRRLLAVRDGGSPFVDAEADLATGLSAALALQLAALDHLAEQRRYAGSDTEAAAQDARTGRMLLEQLAVVQRAVARRAPLNEIFDAITAGARSLLGDAIAALAMRDGDDPDMLHLASTCGFPDEVRHRLWRASLDAAGVTGQAIRRDEIVVFDGSAQAPESADDGIEAGVQAAMAAPVRHQDKVVGGLFVASRRPDRVYGPADQAVLTAFAEHVGVAIEAARAVDGLYQAFHDPLTGLASSALFRNRLVHTLALAAREKSRVAVVLFNLHRFKTVNDTFGHAAGDLLLTGVAERLSAGLRATDTLARFGADEFAILLAGVEQAEPAMEVTERLAASLRRPFWIGGREVTIDSTAGIAFSALGERDADALLQGADLALTAAKQDGPGCIEMFQPGMQVVRARRAGLEMDLRHAVERDQLMLHYQPIVDLSDGRVTGCEALVRWAHPERGTVSPLDFISLAEETGYIVSVGSWVLHEACRQAAEWNRSLPGAGLHITVNLSARQIRRPDLPDLVAGVLRQTGLAPELLTLEITESVLVHDVDATVHQLHKLKALGVRLAIDDFGTGYSSLAYLRRFPVDILKIDKMFVDDIGVETPGASLTPAIVGLGRTLGLVTVAEGIEDASQWKPLLESGCDQGQGYYFARPQPAGEVEKLLFDAYGSRVVGTLG
ncbi:putative bifunctional diguanylate cyclase/phosphodiesterase [Couchioplanes azureus]|uniref:putative bifunctional diguanylate cyclase/phosphodiesterase n=1 Tax=Couchioplanes caeruleus TaxID=56438 RepID=UPI00166FE8E9|nr:EAL domain-containing protein [Couchioplanes caeruleus]